MSSLRQEISVEKNKYSFDLRDVRRNRGHTFVLSPGLLGSAVIDAGAHRCEFAYMMASKYGARVIALEPNRALPVDHSHEEVTLLRVALSEADGEGSLFIDDNPEGSSIIRDGVQDTESQAAVPCEFRSLRSLVAEFNINRIGLLKLDIEGAEFGVIQSIDDDLARLIHQITIEFHPAAPTSAELPKIENAIAYLEALGFQMCRSSYRGYGDIVLLNSRYFEIPGKFFRAALPYYRKTLEIFFEQ